MKCKLLSPFFVNEEYCIITGYKSSADKLVDSITDFGSITEIYPIMFLYRQFLELYMKSIYKLYIADSNNDYTEYLKRVKHHLIKSFDEIYPLIEKYLILNNNSNGDNQILCKKIKTHLKYMSCLDEFGFNFRFSSDLKGNKIRKSEIEINITEIKNNINEIANFLTMLEENVVYTRELEKEMINELYS